MSKDKNQYPTQYEAETMAAWMNISKDFYLGGCGPEVRAAWNKAEQARLDMHIKTFGPASPWDIRLNKKREAEVFWNNEKAKTLNIK